MTKPTPLPDPYLARPFTVGDATAHGVTPRRLRARDLDRSIWGVRVVAHADWLGRCRMLQLRMPTAAFFSHSTAARILGVPVPLALENDARLHVGVPAPSRAPHAAGIAGHKLAIDPAKVRVVEGLRVTSAERTWCDLGSVLPLHDLVAAGDFVIHWNAPLATLGGLGLAVRRRVSRRGLVTLHAALPLLSDRAESAPESVLRVIIVLAGLPTPRANQVVTDRFGEFVARTDLIIDEYRLVLEYMGDYHRETKGQWRADMTRRSRLEAQGWRVMELNADDLRDPDDLVERIRQFARLPVT